MNAFDTSPKEAVLNIVKDKFRHDENVISVSVIATRPNTDRQEKMFSIPTSEIAIVQNSEYDSMTSVQIKYGSQTNEPCDRK